ncbi:DUF3310 domain-containing protein [Streptomyces sp. NPDC091280]|uniref:DUF3310 domain-containing protein n=1 Tax=Streptomyces sp. NPDC091280 TaxID=3365984 RepID=UPI00381BF7EC
MNFEVGDIVIIWNPGTPYTKQFKDHRAVITEIHEGEAFPYGVTFKNGYTLGFTAEEITPALETENASDPVNHPAHYTWLPGIEVIDITQHFSFVIGNALKYLMRAGHKGDAVEDLKKALWYIQFELKRLESN